MSLNKVSDVEKNVVEIEFSVDKETFDKAVNAAYKKNVGKMNVPGFRKGKAPRQMIEKLYGKGVFYDEALNAVIPDAYEDALKASGKDVVSQPEFDVVSIDDNGVVLKAKVTIKPEVEIKDYKGIAVTKELVETTDAEIDAEIEAARKKNAREIEVTDREAAKDDIAVIDYEGFCDGEAFEGGKGTDHSLRLGSGEFIPGFEDQIVGHKAGEDFDVNVTFPKEYHSEKLAGKDATFKVTLKTLKFEELPALDDEFAKDVSEFDTLDEYKASVKSKIDERHRKAADAAVEEQLVSAICEKLEGEIPEVMYENEVDAGIRDMANRMAQQGIKMDMYLQYTGMTMDALKKEMRPKAEKQVKTRLALEKIAALENLEAAEEDIAKEYESIAAAYGLKAEDVRGKLDETLLTGDIKARKAVQLIKDAAVITDKKAEAKD